MAKGIYSCDSVSIEQVSQYNGQRTFIPKLVSFSSDLRENNKWKMEVVTEWGFLAHLALLERWNQGIIIQVRWTIQMGETIIYGTLVEKPLGKLSFVRPIMIRKDNIKEVIRKLHRGRELDRTDSDHNQWVFWYQRHLTFTLLTIYIFI